jgi:hypothetical protein
MPPTGLEQAVEATTVPWGTRLGPRGEGRMPPGVDRRYASAEPIQRELKVGFERAFLAVPRRPSDLWVRTLDLVCKVRGFATSPSAGGVKATRGVKDAAAPRVVTQRRLAFREALRAA